MPARTTKIRHDENTRAKIQVALIIQRLEQHLNGKIELTNTQVSCAKILLAKVLPDLQSVEHSGEVTTRYVTALPETDSSVEAWQASKNGNGRATTH